MNKRGQRASAGGAAILVIVLAAIFVLYILFLPPGDRAALLGENETGSATANHTASGYNRILLDEHIGRLDYLKFSYRTHDIPSFRIYSEVKGSTIQSRNSIYVRNTVGKDKFYNMTFDINKKATSDALLAFNVASARGRLEILLNGHLIFDGELKEGTPEPIPLQSEFLEDSNVLSFKVSGPGIIFWRPNEYELKNVQVTGNVLDDSNSISRQFFYLSQEEKDNLKDVKLMFYPTCTVSEVGTLKIYINGDEVFSGIADCGIYNTLFMNKDAVFEGRNQLEFIASKGSYLFDRVSVRTDLNELLYPVYYFDLDKDLFKQDAYGQAQVLKDDFNVTLHLRFVDRSQKRLEYVINGRRRSISTDELTYNASLDPYLFPESNSLELDPRSAVDIARMRVVLDEK